MIRLLLILVALSAVGQAQARDTDGRWAQSPNKEWFDGLKSEYGLCCSISDGRAVDDPDWRRTEAGYEVFLNGGWLAVPPGALVTVPNKLGRAMVWPVFDDESGTWAIKCFLPGAET